MKRSDMSCILWSWVLVILIGVGCAEVDRRESHANYNSDQGVFSDTTFIRGNPYLEKGEYDKALADFNKVIELYPNSSDSYFIRGVAFTEKGLYDQAIADFTKAIELNPNNAQTYLARGNVYAKLRGRWKESWDDYWRAVEIDPKLALGYLPHSAFLVFRDTMGDMERRGIVDLEIDSPGLGTKISYFSESPYKDVATGFVYDRGLANIPNGVPSASIEQEFERSVTDIFNAERTGIYRELKRERRTITTIGSYKGGFEALWASFSGLLSDDLVISHLYLTALNNHFVKIRYTYRAASEPEMQTTLSGFLEDIAIMVVQGRSAKKRMSYYRKHPDQAAIKKQECRAAMTFKGQKNFDVRDIRAVLLDYECNAVERVVALRRIKD